MYNNHSHITYNEIKKYMETEDDYFLLSDLDFYVDFEERLYGCTVCRDRFDLYFFTSSLISVSEEYTDIKNTSLISDFLERLRNAGEILCGCFTLTPPPALSFRGSGNELDKNIVSITRGDDSGASSGSLVIDSDDEYFKFEISKLSELRFTMLEPELSEKYVEYRFYVCCEEGGVENCYTLKKTKKGMSIITDMLPVGKYLGAVIGINHAD